MKRFTSLDELHDFQASVAISAALHHALQSEYEIAHPNKYDPDDQGSVWLLQPTDTDETLIKAFGVSLNQLLFEKVCHYQSDNFFICYLVRNNSCCDTLVIPDAHWLESEWRASLISQL